MGKARAYGELFNLLGGVTKKAKNLSKVRSFQSGVEVAARSGNYLPYELELAKLNPGYNPRKSWQGGGNEQILFGQTGNAQPSAYYGDSVRSAQEVAMNRPDLNSTLINPYKPNLRPNTRNYLGNQIDQSARDWYTPGGGHDQALEAVLKIKRGKFKGEYTIEQLIEMHQNTTKKSDKVFLKNKIDEYESMLATGPAKNADDVIVYKVKSQSTDARTAILEGSEDYIPAYDKSLEFHHKSMKKLEGVFWRKAKEFLRKGDVDPDDLANLHKQGQVMGAESGSRADAAVLMHRPLHNEYLHKGRMIPGGVEPRIHKDLGGGKLKRGKNNRIQGLKGIDSDIIDALSKTDVKYKADIDWIMNWVPTVGIEEAIKKWRKSGGYKPTGLSEMDEWVKRIENVKTWDELMDLHEEMIENIALPMTNMANRLEDTFSNWSPRDIQQLRNDPNSVETITKALDDKAKSDYDNRLLKIQKAERQGGIIPEELPDPEFTEDF